MPKSRRLIRAADEKPARRPWRKKRIEIAMVVLSLIMLAFTIAAIAINK